jgi:hypothetical protein
VSALTPFQRRRLVARRDVLLPEWEIRTEKVGRLRAARGIETGVSVRFQLDHQVLADEAELAKLEKELESIEKILNQ